MALPSPAGRARCTILGFHPALDDPPTRCDSFARISSLSGPGIVVSAGAITTWGLLCGCYCVVSAMPIQWFAVCGEWRFGVVSDVWIVGVGRSTVPVIGNFSFLSFCLGMVC